LVSAAAALFHLLLHPGPFAGVLGGLMMTDQASDAGAEQAMVTEKMPADTADCRTFQAARGIGRGAGQASDQQWYCKDHPALHVTFSVVVNRSSLLETLRLYEWFGFPTRRMTGGL
jgi:hypothetical protein